MTPPSNQKRTLSFTITDTELEAFKLLTVTEGDTPTSVSRDLVLDLLVDPNAGTRMHENRKAREANRKKIAEEIAA